MGMAYKAVNTLDSMVGYKNERYIDFGCASARLDDADMERELSGAYIVVDATHPFATLASGNIRAASLAVGCLLYTS